VLPVAIVKFKVLPSHVVKAGNKAALLDDLAVIAVAFDNIVWFCNTTVFDVAVPHPPDTITLYLVPAGGTLVVVLVIVNVDPVTPE